MTVPPTTPCSILPVWSTAEKKTWFFSIRKIRDPEQHGIAVWNWRAGIYLLLLIPTAGPCLTGWRNFSNRLQTRRVGAAGGAEEYDEHGTVMQQAIHFCMTSFLTTGGIRGTAGTRLTRYYPRTFNMAISREAFSRAGGFRQLGHGPIYGEDIDLSIRIEKAGLKLVFHEGAKVFHRRRDSLRGFFKQVLKMGAARAMLARLHPEMTGPLHLAPAAGVAVLALTLVLAPFFAAAAAALAWMAVLGAGFYAVLGVSAFCRAKRLSVALLAGFIGFVQQAAYGIGFYCGLWKGMRGSMNG